MGVGFRMTLIKNNPLNSPIPYCHDGGGFQGNSQLGLRGPKKPRLWDSSTPDSFVGIQAGGFGAFLDAGISTKIVIFLCVF